MTGVLEPPRRLRRGDSRAGFASGAPDLDEWFVRFAWENQQAGNAVTYVAVRDQAVLGYYSIAAASYASDGLPVRLAKNRPALTPCILLARLGVDRRAQGKGLGASLLRDALERVFQLSRQVGAAALLIHCLDSSSRAFYLANGDFLQSPVEPLHLMLPMKDLRRGTSVGQDRPSQFPYGAL
jgi:GNAT superfamily N-acetyltransferase